MNSLLRRYLLLTLVIFVHGCGSPQDGSLKAIAQTAPVGKLPDNVRPQAYRLHMLLDPRRDDFSGDVEIDVQLDNSGNSIWIHGEGLQVTKASAVLSTGQEVAAEYAETQESGVAQLRFAEELPAGIVTLHLSYHADFNRNLAGLFKVEEQGESYVLAKSESIQARKYLPAFDEPGFKATFDITLTVPIGYAAISNGPEIDRKPASDGLEVVTFASTRPVSTYLLSLAVGPFDIVERPAIPPSEFRTRPIELRGYSRKGRGADMNLILDITPRMVEIFERQLQYAYPYKKLDIVAAPQWPSGATELAAAITYREQAILLGDDPAPGARLRMLQVHAHEISHMWFGNLVTPPWWDDLWLKEGIASWSEPVILMLFEPDGGHDLDAAAASIRAMSQDSLASTRAVREPIAENKNIRNAYDSITYSKSLGVIRMVDEYFGVEKFRGAMGRYVSAFVDGVADSSDFYAVIGEETGTPELTETFRSFVEQKGVPLLEFAMQCDGDAPPSLQITQSRYKPLGSQIDATGQKWVVPVCLRSDSGHKQCLMVTEPEQTVELQGASCPTWILPNANGSGYYRWTLAESEWQSLLNDFAALEPAEALSAVDSAFAAFEAGSLSAPTLLQLVQRSAASETRQVVVAPLPYLEKYARDYLRAEHELAFLQFAQKLYQPVLERSSDSEDGEQQLLHSTLVSFMASTAKDPQWRQQLLEDANVFTGFEVEQNMQAMDSDMYEAALTVAVQDNPATYLQHLVRFRSELDDPLFERASAAAIGLSTNPDTLTQVHELALSDAMGVRETASLIRNALSEPALRDQHWQWFKESFVAIVDKLPEQSRRSLPSYGSVFCDASYLEELQQLFEQQSELVPGYERAMAQTEERIQLCAALAERSQTLIDELR